VIQVSGEIYIREDTQPSLESHRAYVEEKLEERSDGVMELGRYDLWREFSNDETEFTMDPVMFEEVYDELAAEGRAYDVTVGSDDMEGLTVIGKSREAVDDYIDAFIDDHEETCEAWLETFRKFVRDQERLRDAFAGVGVPEYAATSEEEARELVDLYASAMMDAVSPLLPEDHSYDPDPVMVQEAGSRDGYGVPGYRFDAGYNDDEEVMFRVQYRAEPLEESPATVRELIDMRQANDLPFSLGLGLAHEAAHLVTMQLPDLMKEGNPYDNTEEAANEVLRYTWETVDREELPGPLASVDRDVFDEAWESYMEMTRWLGNEYAGQHPIQGSAASIRDVLTSDT
jgi:hypothetical protein